MAQEEINVTSDKLVDAEEAPYCLANNPLFSLFPNKLTEPVSEIEYKPHAKPPPKSKAKKVKKVKNAKVDTVQGYDGEPDAVVSGITSFPPSSPALRNVTRSDYPVSYTHLTLPTKRIV